VSNWLPGGAGSHQRQPDGDLTARRSARASSRLATLAHAMSHNITATPEIQVATLVYARPIGPRDVRMIHRASGLRF